MTVRRCVYRESRPRADFCFVCNDKAKLRTTISGK